MRLLLRILQVMNRQPLASDVHVMIRQLTLDNVKDLMYRLRFKHVLSNMTVQYPYKLQRVSTFRAYLRSIKHGYLQLSMAVPDDIRAVTSSAIKQLYDGDWPSCQFSSQAVWHDSLYLCPMCLRAALLGTHCRVGLASPLRLLNTQSRKCVFKLLK